MLRVDVFIVSAVLFGCTSLQLDDEIFSPQRLTSSQQLQDTIAEVRDSIVGSSTQRRVLEPIPALVNTFHESIVLSPSSLEPPILLSGGQPITVKVKQLPLQMFANALARITGKNFVVESSIQNNPITAYLHDLPWRDLVLIIAKAHDFQVQQSGRAISFTLLQQQTSDKTAKKTGAATATAMRADLFRLAYAQPETLKAIFEPLFEGQKNKPRFSVDTRTRSLIVKANAVDSELIGTLTRHLDKPSRQVEIEVFIVEANEDFERNLGARLGFRTFGEGGIQLVGTLNDDGLAVNLPVVNANSGVGILFDRRRLRFELTALERQGKSRIVSNPKIFTLENHEAIIFQGDEVPYFTVSENGTQTEFKEAGIRLAVTPTIIGNDTLLLDITVNKDTVDTRISNPPITRRQVSTKLKVLDGAVIVIGGIYLNTKVETAGRVPLLGKLPLIGALFRQSGNSRDVRQLLVFIAPKILA